MTSTSSHPAHGNAVAELQAYLQTPPPSADLANPVAIAHAALERLRESGDESFLFLRTILQIGSTLQHDLEELLFHCLTGCRQVVLWKWQHHSTVFRRHLRE
jgi:hypothetical protein